MSSGQAGRSRTQPDQTACLIRDNAMPCDAARRTRHGANARGRGISAALLPGAYWCRDGPAVVHADRAWAASPLAARPGAWALSHGLAQASAGESAPEGLGSAAIGAGQRGWRRDCGASRLPGRSRWHLGAGLPAALQRYLNGLAANPPGRAGVSIAAGPAGGGAAPHHPR